MKKLFLSVVFGLLTAFVVCLPKNISVRAYAAGTAELGIRVETVTEKKTLQGKTINVGDIKVTITVVNNPGFAACGMTVNYPNGVTPVMQPDGKHVVFEKGPAGDEVGLEVSSYADARTLGCASIGLANEYDNGDIVSFYIEKPSTAIDLKTAFTLEVGSFYTYDGKPIPYTADKVWTKKIVKLKLGDIDGDGQITAEDAQLVLALLKANGDMAVTLTEIELENGFNYSALYITLRVNGQEVKFLALGIADVNGDGIVDQDDAEALLDYYLAIITNNTPSNPNIGTWQDIVVWVYV